MINQKKRDAINKKHYLASTFSLAGQSAFFWFDLFLIIISLLVLGFYFFDVAARSIIIYFLIIVSVAGLLPVIYNALKALKDHQLSIDLLASIALIFSLLTREWRSAVFISLMLASARLFARYTNFRAERSIRSLLKLRPTRVHVMRPGGRVIEKAIEEISVNDLIVVVSGERIAVDGFVESGEASIDQSSLTGESEPMAKKTGDQVLASTLNIGGSLVVRAGKVGKDTTFSKVVELVQQSQTEKASISSVVDRFINWYILLTLLGTILLYFLGFRLSLILSILLVTCADDLAVAIPLAFTAAIGLAARRGIIIKGGRFLEGLIKVKTIVFDKTGTITEGRPQVEDVVIFDNYPQHQLLAFLGAAESESDHPAARAIYKFVEDKKIIMPLIIKVHEEPGFGIRGKIDQEEVLAGKTKFLRDNGIIFTPEQIKIIDEQKARQRTITILSVNKKAVGFVAMKDTIRPAAPAVMARLKQMGVKRLVMLTGDNEKIAADVAGHVGITEFKANLLPQDKIDNLKKILDPSYKVAMVGDGVNDAASLALSDIGIAMGAIGSDAAIESADIVLVKDNLNSIPEIIETSRYVLKIVRQNLWIWGAVNALGLIFVFWGLIGPSGAAAYNFLTDFIPLFNSFRIFSFKGGAAFWRKA